MIKLQEGERLEQVESRDGEVELIYGGAPLHDFDHLLNPDRILRQSFPEYVDFVRTTFGSRALGPNAYAAHSLDLFLRLTLVDPGDDLASLLALVRQVSVVELARQVAPLAGPTASDYSDPTLDPSVAEPHQGYLMRGPRHGVDARYAWHLRSSGGGPSGAGAGVTVCLLDPGVCTTHPNIPDIPETSGRFHGVSETATTDQRHGAMVLGILGAPHDGGDGTGGTIGLCRDAVFHYCGTEPKSGSTADKAADIAAVLKKALPALPGYSVLVIETELSMLTNWKPENEDPVFWDAGDGKGKGRVPVEVNLDLRTLLVAATLLQRITVVEAAGNSGGELGKIVDLDTGDVVWDPPPSGADESGAVMVGSGNWDDQSYLDSNHGPRVDCQGWGLNVWAPYCPPPTSGSCTAPAVVTGGDNCYDTIDATSSASAIIAGVVACLQGGSRAIRGVPLDPAKVRNMLRADGLGTPQPLTDANHIGPLPDLYRLFTHLRIAPDLYLRDHLTDLGAPQPFLAGGMSPFFWNRSPDLVVRKSSGLVLDASNWMVEKASERLALKNRVTIRVRNLGHGPDDGTFALWACQPASFLHPRWWIPIATGHLPLIPGGDVHAESVSWSTAALPVLQGHHVALIGAIWPHRNLRASELHVAPAAISLPVSERPTISTDASTRHAMSTDEFRELIAESNDIAFRSVQWETGSPGDMLEFEYVLVGVPEGPDNVRLVVTSDLPLGTRVIVTPLTGALVSSNVPAINWSPASPYDGPLLTGSARFNLATNETIGIKLEVELHPHITPGSYETSIDQYLTPDTHLGRITFIARVEPSTPS